MASIAQLYNSSDSEEEDEKISNLKAYRNNEICLQNSDSSEDSESDSESDSSNDSSSESSISSKDSDSSEEENSKR